jgi:hypothetical protein
MPWGGVTTQKQIAAEMKYKIVQFVQWCNKDLSGKKCLMKRTTYRLLVDKHDRSHVVWVCFCPSADPDPDLSR